MKNQFEFLELADKILGAEFMDFMLTKYNEKDIPGSYVILAFAQLKQNSIQNKIKDTEKKIESEPTIELHKKRKELNKQLIETNQFIIKYLNGGNQ